MTEQPPFFRPHKNDLGLTKFTKPYLTALERAEKMLSQACELPPDYFQHCAEASNVIRLQLNGTPKTERNPQ